MYKPPQQRSQSRIPTTTPKANHNQQATGSFRVQPQLENSQTPPETQKYSPELADLLAAKMTSATRQPAAQALPIQTKLTVGAPGDKYEQEADSMASKVMSMSDSAVQRQRALGTQIQPQVQARFIQRAPDRSVLAGGKIENQLQSSQGGGSPLSGQIRAYMEPRFGADFSRVRVHTGEQAVQMNRELGAQAFTHGNNIYYGGGKSPGVNELTAHELTHVVQQTGELVQRHLVTQKQPNPTEINQNNQNSVIQRVIYEDAKKKKPYKDIKKSELYKQLTEPKYQALLFKLHQDKHIKFTPDEAKNFIDAYFKTPLPPTTLKTDANVNNEGKQGHKGSVGTGKVSSHTGVEFELANGQKYSEGFSIGYKGKDAGENRWLQFIWREIIVQHPDKGEYRLNQSITTTGGQYNLTTDPKNPNYNTDTADPSSPFYEAAFVANRTADSTTIYDQPSSMEHLILAELKKGATKVISRAHFNTYLIKDYRASYHVGVDVEWTYTNSKTPPRLQKVRSGGKTNALPEKMRARLLQQYPGFSYIQ